MSAALLLGLSHTELLQLSLPTLSSLPLRVFELMCLNLRQPSVTVIPNCSCNAVESTDLTVPPKAFLVSFSCFKVGACKRIAFLLKEVPNFLLGNIRWKIQNSAYISAQHSSS